MTNATAPTREQELTEKLALLKSEHADIHGEAQRLEAEAVKAESGVRALVEDLAHPLDSAGISRARQLVDELRQGATDQHARAAAFAAKHEIPGIETELQQLRFDRQQAEAAAQQRAHLKDVLAEVEARCEYMRKTIVALTASEWRIAFLLNELSLVRSGGLPAGIFNAGNQARISAMEDVRQAGKAGRLAAYLPARTPES